MNKSYPTMLLCVAVAVAAAGCATQPSPKPPTITLAALAKQLGVSPALLEVALKAGYNPEIEGGKTVFCRHDEQTGTMVGRLQCEDPERLQIDLQARQQFVDALHQQVSQTAISPRPGGPP
ncbi:MAG TPA: hypothetical protein VGR92_04910 [Steroidobacteraceae bacterium]|nr:hypothetical protein [Steroidobacteraceae bacterium]